MILWRLKQDWSGLLEGACINEVSFKKVYYIDKCLFEPVIDKKDYIEADCREYLLENKLECVLFYNQSEVINFIKKLK